MMDFEKQKQEWNAKMIEDWKQRILERANETLEAWKNGVNQFASRHADLMMVDDYVRLYGADKAEMKKFINDAYSLDRI